jgi:hypothetical protein
VEFQRIAAEEQAHLQRELSREVNDADKGEPKWKMKVRLHTASHSIRPPALNYWNERIDGVNFYPVGNRKQELLMEITLHDRITIDKLFDAGLMVSKLYIVALNVGSGGYFSPSGAAAQARSSLPQRNHVAAWLVAFQDLRSGTDRRGEGSALRLLPWRAGHPVG